LLSVQPQARIAATIPCAAAATSAAGASDMRPAMGSATCAISRPSRQTVTPPPSSASRLAASTMSGLEVPTTIMWWLSCATVEATAQGRS
jgi:hypothetical protein